MTVTLAVTVMPSRAAAGRPHASGAQLWDTAVDDLVIVSRSAHPLLDTARALLAEGTDPETVLVVRRDGSCRELAITTVAGVIGAGAPAATSLAHRL